VGGERREGKGWEIQGEGRRMFWKRLRDWETEREEEEDRRGK
jgi:hypothetical protein